MDIAEHDKSILPEDIQNINENLHLNQPLKELTVVLFKNLQQEKNLRISEKYVHFLHYFNPRIYSSNATMCVFERLNLIYQPCLFNSSYL